VTLTWSQVDFDAGVNTPRARHHEESGGAGVSVPVLPPLAQLLEERRELTRTLERERGEIIPHVFIGTAIPSGP
jgi:integrase